MNKLIDEVVRIVNSKQGIKATELAVEMAQFPEQDKSDRTIRFNSQSILDAIDAAVKQRRIIEIEYCLSNMPDRIKSFYLPANTEIKISNTELCKGFVKV